MHNARAISPAATSAAAVEAALTALPTDAASTAPTIRSV